MSPEEIEKIRKFVEDYESGLVSTSAFALYADVMLPKMAKEIELLNEELDRTNSEFHKLLIDWR